jgi:hypothetical protein
MATVLTIVKTEDQEPKRKRDRIFSIETPPSLPIPQLTERFGAFEQMGKTTGRFGYRQWCYDDAVLGVRAGDVIKIDLRVAPKGVRGEIVWVEIVDNNIETMGVLEAWSASILEVWNEVGSCERGSTKDCLPRKVLGKLQLEPSQRAFLMRQYAGTGNPADWEGRQRLREVLKPRPSGMKADRPAEPSPLAWILSQPKHGRLLDLTAKLKQRK